jgi:hypothetical protein
MLLLNHDTCTELLCIRTAIFWDVMQHILINITDVWTEYVQRDAA